MICVVATTGSDPPRLIDWWSLHQRKPSLQRFLSPHGHRRRDFRLPPSADQPEEPLTFVNDRSRARIHPYDQNRAGTERIKNSAAHDSKRFPSYPELTRFSPVNRHDPPGCPRKVNRIAYPFAPPLHRDASSKAPQFQLSYAAFRPCLSTTNVHDQRYVWPTSAIPHVKNEHSMLRAITESLAGVAPDALLWTLRFTPQNPLRSASSVATTSVLFSPRAW